MTDSNDTLVVPLGTDNRELVAVEAGVKLLRKSIDLGGGEAPTEEGNQYLDELLQRLDEVILEHYREDGDPAGRPATVPVALTVSTAALLCRLFDAAGRLGPDGVAMAAMNAGLRFDGTAEDFEAMHRRWADVAARIRELLPPDARPVSPPP